MSGNLALQDSDPLQQLNKYLLSAWYDTGKMAMAQKVIKALITASDGSLNLYREGVLVDSQPGVFETVLEFSLDRSSTN